MYTVSRDKSQDFFPFFAVPAALLVTNLAYFGKSVIMVDRGL